MGRTLTRTKTNRKTMIQPQAQINAFAAAFFVSALCLFGTAAAAPSPAASPSPSPSPSPDWYDDVTKVVSQAASSLNKGFSAAPNDYAPTGVNCPAVRPNIRLADGLSPQETDWLRRRRANTVEPMKDLLRRLGIPGLDTDKYIDAQKSSADFANLPNIGIASSGGGYRALLNGAGALAAFDSRTAGATGKGQVGGVLQASTYLAGLSGGSWLVGSVMMNNFSTIESLLNTDPAKSQSAGLWQFERNILQGPESGVLDVASYLATVSRTVDRKEKAGYNTTITDYWGRALSYQLINAPSGGPGYTWSSVADQDDFKAGNWPLPFAVADARQPGEVLISLNTTVFELGPFEIGSYDPTLYGFAPTKYVGSEFLNGQLGGNGTCITGFDNAGYVMGTSSSLFNAIIFNLNSVGDLPSLLKTALEAILKRIGQAEEDIADWSPNPFRGWRPDANLNAGVRQLTLVDGGEDLQNIPFHPLIQPIRKVDVIFGIDSSADTAAPGSFWPNGTSIIATYERSKGKISNGTSFPAVPDVNSFINLGLNARPTFFGCDPTNTTSITPLIVYLPNAPYSYGSNFSTFQTEYTKLQQRGVVQNGYNVVTMGNATVDPEWPTCLGCAILSRSLYRTKTKVPDACTRCMNRYCWNGTRNSSPPNPPYNPSLIVARGANGAMVGNSGNTKNSSATLGRHTPSTLLVGLFAVMGSLFLGGGLML